MKRSASKPLDEGYHADYRKEPIGGGNPYYRCVHCQISDPQINGRIKGHASYCEYRLAKEMGTPYRGN
jgi:hypothetical protein